MFQHVFVVFVSVWDDVRVSKWAKHSLRTQRMSGLIEDLFFPTLPCSDRAASDFPGVKRLWYTPAMVKNQDVLAQLISRMEAEKQSGPRSIDNPLSISALAFIDNLAGDKCAPLFGISTKCCSHFFYINSSVNVSSFISLRNDFWVCVCVENDA